MDSAYIRWLREMTRRDQGPPDPKKQNGYAATNRYRKGGQKTCFPAPGTWEDSSCVGTSQTCKTPSTARAGEDEARAGEGEGKQKKKIEFEEDGNCPYSLKALMLKHSRSEASLESGLTTAFRGELLSQRRATCGADCRLCFRLGPEYDCHWSSGHPRYDDNWLQWEGTSTWRLIWQRFMIWFMCK